MKNIKLLESQEIVKNEEYLIMNKIDQIWKIVIQKQKAQNLKIQRMEKNKQKDLIDYMDIMKF